MDILYTELQRNSDTNSLKRIEKEAEFQATIMGNLIKVIEELKTEILMNYEDKMRTASDTGYRHCVLYEFDRNETINDDHKKIFLLNGPINDRGKGKYLSYFENMNINPLINQINETLRPFIVRVKYHGRTKKYKLVVYW